MWIWLTAIGLALLAIFLVVDWIQMSRRRRRRYAAALEAWRSNGPDERVAAIRKLAAELDKGVRNAQAWYLLGCHHLAEGEFKEAARAFGVAHHADFRFASAALLTFTALKAASPAGGDWITLLAATWREIGSPDPEQTPEDAQTLKCLESTTRDPPLLSPLGRLAWLVSGPEGQARIERALHDPSDPARADLSGSEIGNIARTQV